MAVKQSKIGGLKPNEITTIDFMVTEECNMSCQYCFHKQSPLTFTLDEGKKTLDRMKEINPNKLNITFFGGEPLLYPQLVLDLAKYARTLWPDVKQGERIVHNCNFHIVTNGTYFDEEMFKKYKELGFTIQVSLDGDEITHKEHRGGDFQQIVSNTKKMLNIFPNLSARMTFTPQTVRRLSINVKFLREEVGIVKLMHHAVMEADWTEEDIAQYTYQLKQVYHYRRFLKKKGIPINIAFVDKPLSILNDDAPSQKEFCQAGKSYIAILPNGDIYPCHRAASSRIFKLGNLYNKRPFIRGIFLDLDKEVAGCHNKCNAIRTCHSCPITHYKVNGDLTQPIQKYCTICQGEYELAKAYLPIERTDKQERMLKKMSRVVIDLAEQIEEIKNDRK